MRPTLATLCLLSLPAALALPGSVLAQPSAAGDVMFVGYNADGDAGFALLALVDLPAGTEIHVSDNEWDGVSAFWDLAEGEATWTNDTGVSIAAGTVLVFTDMRTSPAVSAGAIAGETIGVGGSDEQLWAYLGTPAEPSTFLSAITCDDFEKNGNSLDNTGLVIGTTAIEIDGAGVGDEDVMVYDGPASCDGLTRIECATQIADVVSNWSTQDGGGDESADDIYPDFPDDLVGDFTTVPVGLLSFSIE